MSAEIQYQRFNVEQYYKMAEVGILNSRDRVELINGGIIKLNPIRSPHASMVDKLSDFLFGDLRGKAIIRVQSAISINEYSEPEPDFCILKKKEDWYESGHPKPKDVYFLIEVSDSTLKKDRKLKLALYAESKIEEYWIVNLPDQQIEIYRKPSGKRYKEKEILKGKDFAKSKMIDFNIQVNQLFKTK